MTQKLESKEVAKLIRQELKAHFPGIKFSVTSDYNTINVKWTDGPTQKDVDEVVNFFKGQEKYSFPISNGGLMQDSYRWVEKEYQGQTVQFGNKYVFTSRTHSAAFYEICLKQYAIITNEKDRFQKAHLSVKPSSNHCTASIEGMDIALIDDIYRFSRAYSNFS